MSIETERRLTRVLLAIDALCLVDERTDTDDTLGIIYRLAHHATGFCCVHRSWDEELDKVVADLKSNKTCDVDRLLAEGQKKHRERVKADYKKLFGEKRGTL